MSQAQEIRALIEKIGTTQRGAAKKIGVSDRAMRQYCSEKDPQKAPKPVMMALHCLANHQ